MTNLVRFTGREEMGARTGGRDDDVSFAGTEVPLMVPAVALGFGCSSVEYFSRSSPMVTLRNERGRRLTRISMRVRRVCAWML